MYLLNYFLQKKPCLIKVVLCYMILITFKHMHMHMQVELRGRIAYVPQLPWIQNGTIEENILCRNPTLREM